MGSLPHSTAAALGPIRFHTIRSKGEGRFRAVDYGTLQSGEGQPGDEAWTFLAQRILDGSDRQEIETLRGYLEEEAIRAAINAERCNQRMAQLYLNVHRNQNGDSDDDDDKIVGGEDQEDTEEPSDVTKNQGSRVRPKFSGRMTGIPRKWLSMTR